MVQNQKEPKSRNKIKKPEVAFSKVAVALAITEKYRR